MQLFWICCGGALGTALRYGVQTLAVARLGLGFPYGTLIVNLVGSYLIGAIMHVSMNTDMIPETVRLALVTGVMGGLTTYSSFNYETLELLRRGDWRIGIANVVVTGSGCLLMGMLGLATGRRIAGG